jgi:hypothetical protein
LADATRKARAFCHPILILPWIDDCLSHIARRVFCRTNVHLQTLLCQPSRKSVAGTCLEMRAKDYRAVRSDTQPRAR